MTFRWYSVSTRQPSAYLSFPVIGALSLFQLKIQYGSELAELCIRLLERWEEKETNKATKKLLAHALWMAGEEALAKEFSETNR